METSNSSISNFNHVRAAWYRREVRCANCINYENCIKEGSAELKHLYDPFCLKELYELFESGTFDSFIGGIESALDWNLEVPEQHMNIYRTYMKIFEI